VLCDWPSSGARNELSAFPSMRGLIVAAKRDQLEIEIMH
jgi:hypothetical protein